MAPRLRALALLAAVLAAPLALRGALLLRDRLVPTLVDLRGASADLAVGLVVALLLAALMRWSRLAVGGLLGLWTLGCYANYEHVLALDANAALAYAHYLLDPTFTASATSVSSPGLLIGLGLVVAGLGTLAIRGGRASLAGAGLPWAGAALAALVIQPFWPDDPASLRWRQDNVLIENIRGIGRAEPALEGARPRAERGGEPRIALDHAGRNVLLLVVEGVSGAHLRSIASAQGHVTPYQMPHLSGLAQRGVTFTNFVSVQRQTNRGMYALLCGDLPLLGTGPPRMSEYAVQGGPTCLPSVLADAGYRTVFLQAAPLAFMMKDQFMPRAGFARTLGVEFFDRAYARSRWGVDDLAFLEQSLDMIRSLRAQPEPWFLTLLTSGTHHPFNVPDGFRADGEPGSHPHAAQYLDRAIGRFLELIGESGLLDDTLVLVTSDESAGLREGGGFVRGLAQNWGFAIALTPEQTRLDVNAPYSQLDVAVSILDYLGLRDRMHEFSGRSLFREYAKPREIVFANTYLRTVGGVSAGKRFYVCDEELQNCSSWEADRRRLFASPGKREAVSSEEIAFLRAAVRRSRAPLAESLAREFELMSPGRVALAADNKGLQWIFGGQNFAIPSGTRLEVQVELALHGRTEEGQAHLIHDFSSEGKRLLVRRLPTLEPGDRMRIAYSYATTEAMRTAVVRLWTSPQRLPSPGLVLEVVEARVRLLPDTEPEHPDEVELDVYELVRPRPVP